MGKDNRLGLDKYLNFSGWVRVRVLPKHDPWKKKEKKGKKERKNMISQPISQTKFWTHIDAHKR